MVQDLVAYCLVAAAAGWTLWSMSLRGWLRRRASAKSDIACGGGCGGGCGGD